MQSNISDSRSYAFQTTATETQAIEADQLMRKAVSSYQVGDTRTTKSILEVLMASPYSYTPMHERVGASHVQSAQDMTEADQGGARAKFAQGEVFTVSIYGELIKQIPSDHMEGNTISVTTASGKKPSKHFTDKDNKLNQAGKVDAGFELIVLDGFHTRKPVGILKAVSGGGGGKGKKGGGARWSYSDYDAHMTRGVKTFEDKTQRDRKRKLQQSAKPNPKYSISKKGSPQKRGNYLLMEIHHKNRMTMKRKSSGSHGSSKNTAKWTKGLNKLFPGEQLVQTGILKSTGQEAPYRIRLPVTHFKRITHPTLGTPTIGVKKGDAKLKKVFQDILDTYGRPKHVPDKGTHHRYIIPVKQQGSYQSEVRRQVGKAKAKR
jgi:hypothetical protein